MKPFRTLAETTAPDGGRFTLHEHDGEYFMKLNGRQLMSSTSTSSEILLAKLACENLLRHPHPRVLIGGLGLGFSLKAVLSLVGKKAEVHVAELLPEVIEWNRQFLMKLNGALLNDRRWGPVWRSSVGSRFSRTLQVSAPPPRRLAAPHQD